MTNQPKSINLKNILSEALSLTNLNYQNQDKKIHLWLETPTLQVERKGW